MPSPAFSRSNISTPARSGRGAGRYAQAEKYYAMLLQTESPDAQDYLNAGHTAWAGGDTTRAIALYREGCSRKGDTEAFIALLMADADELARQGIAPDDLALMADVLRLGDQPDEA